ncbi:MAG: transcriptional regulator NrdR [Oscillospiraceae bacterium]|jgi:transcriptional repressor NrdR|nr:transcriptional regulator NrdR [Oscillospiraceae bacterium]
MKCPYCACEESKVIDSRPTDDNERIRRRRECNECRKRFTTYEIIETVPLMVVKKDRSRESFDRQKLFNSLRHACDKRAVSVSQLERIVDDIEQSLQNSMEREVPTEVVGTLAMEALKGVDEVSYVRFASVYREFKDLHTFMDELAKILREKK